MEKANTIENYVSSIVKPIFSKALQETNKKRMSVGHKGRPKNTYCLYQPHNYRLYFDFSHKGYDKHSYIKTNVLGLVSKKTVNSKEILYTYEEFTLRVRKKTVEIINKKNYKRWYYIAISQKGEEQIRKIIQKKDKESLSFFKKWLKAHGGGSEYKILNRHSENKIKQEESIDRIPIKQKWHNKLSKKVYNENAVEFYDPATASNYILNRSVESISPEIAESLHKVHRSILYLNPLRVLKHYIKKPEDVIRLEKYVLLLTDKEREELELFLMKL